MWQPFFSALVLTICCSCLVASADETKWLFRQNPQRTLQTLLEEASMNLTVARHALQFATWQTLVQPSQAYEIRERNAYENYYKVLVIARNIIKGIPQSQISTASASEKRELDFYTERGDHVASIATAVRLSELVDNLTETARDLLQPFSSRNYGFRRYFPRRCRSDMQFKFDKYIFPFSEKRRDHLIGTATSFSRVVNALNSWAQALKYKSYNEMLEAPYAVTNLSLDIKQTIEKVTPIYKKLRAFVTRVLHGSKIDYVLGHLVSYREFRKTVENEFLQDERFTWYIKKNLTSILEMANVFFTGLGLPAIFGTNSTNIHAAQDSLQTPCVYQSVDMYDPNEFKFGLLQCSNFVDLTAVFHEVAHVQYYLAYRGQHYPFRRAPHPSFHEGVAKAMGLFVGSPSFLKRHKFLRRNDDTTNMTLNKMFKNNDFIRLMELYVLYKWHSDVYNEPSILLPDHVNAFLKYLKQEMGLGFIFNDRKYASPLIPYAKCVELDYAQHILEILLKYQIHKALCRKANMTVSLHECDIEGNTAVGTLLQQMLSKGNSENWTDQLKALTGSDTISPDAMIEYHTPIIEYIDQLNISLKETEWQGDLIIFKDYTTERIPSVYIKRETFKWITDDPEKTSLLMLFIGTILMLFVLIACCIF